MKSSKNPTPDFFSDLFEARPSKIIAVIISTLGTLALLPIIYGIIWYEKYGSHQKRTLLNKLVSSICWLGILWFSLIQPTDIFRYMYGPLPANLCLLSFTIKLAITTQGLLYLNAIILSKYLFIFWLKNPTAFHDDFWSFFYDIWATLLAWTAHGVIAFLPGKPQAYHYICAGLDPSNDESMEAKSNIFNHSLRILTIIIHVFVLLRIFIFKLKTNYSNSALPKTATASISGFRSQWLFGLEKTSLSDLTTSMTSALALVIAGFLQLQFEGVSVKDYNQYPLYLFEYFYRMVRPTFTGLLIVSFYYYRHQQMRQVMWNELANIFRAILKV